MELRDNISRLKEGILALSAGKKPVLLVAVSKNRSPAEILEAYSAGISDFGENRMQDALPKIHEVEKVLSNGMKTAKAAAVGMKNTPIPARKITWHFIGTLQSNKACDAVSHFDYIHSIDSMKLIDKIAECQEKLAAREKGSSVHAMRIANATGPDFKKPKCFIQVNISGEESKHGFKPQDALPACSYAISKCLDIVGFMGMGPETPNAEKSKEAFMLLDSIRNDAEKKFNRKFLISAGMTSDYKIALGCGADIVRIGRAIFEGSQGHF